MSGALAQLRAMLGDPLFIRAPAGLQPTSRCAELAGPLGKALLDIGNALAGTAFVPQPPAEHAHGVARSAGRRAGLTVADHRRDLAPAPLTIASKSRAS